MGQKTPQNFENHSRIVPAYHYVAFSLFSLNFFVTFYEAVVHFSWLNLATFGLSIALILLFFLARIMAMTVQDRVIRLEERLRMRELLPADLKGRIGEFTPKQLVALRFASDEELPALARKVLDDKMTDQKAIKQLVKNWRADYLRA